MLVFSVIRKKSAEPIPPKLRCGLKKFKESFSTISEKDDVEIAFWRELTGIPKEEMVTYLKLAQPYIKAGKANGIRLSTRPDTISPHILNILNNYGVTVIELGVQSLDRKYCL